MANKKIYTIEINGLNESVKSVDSLTEKITDLQKAINSFKSKKIEIPIELSQDIGKFSKEIEAITKKAQIAISKDKKGTAKGTSAINEDKEVNRVIEAREKALKEVSKEYKELDGTIAKYKKETKDLVAEEVRAKNGAEGYANTLNGLKAELKDLNNLKGDIDLDSTEYEQISKRILELTNRLKDYEAAQGSFGRNVGNYAEGVKEGLEDANKEAKEFEDSMAGIRDKLKPLNNVKLDVSNIKDANISINDLKNGIATLERKLDSVNIGTDEYKRLNDELTNLRDTYNNVQKALQKVVHADDQLKVRWQQDIGGQTYVFDNVTQAIGEIEDKLYKLAAADKRNTDEFKMFAKAAAELKIQLRGVDQEIDYMVEGSAGINKMVNYFQGFSALATAGTGLSQLFGGDDEDAQKQMQTMTALIGVMESVRLISEEMQKQTAFGKMLSKFNNSIDKLIDSFKIFNTELAIFSGGLNDNLDILSKYGGKFNKLEKALDEGKISLNEYFDEINKNSEAFDKFRQASDEVSFILSKKLQKEFKKLNEEIVAMGGDSSLSISEMRGNVQDLLKDISDPNKYEKLNEISKKFIKFSQDVSIASKEGFDLKESGQGFIGYVKAAVGWLSKLLIKLGLLPKSIENGANAFTNLSKGMKLAAIGTTSLSYALKLLRNALKVFLVFELINLVMELLEGIKKMITAIGEWVLGNDKLVNSFDSVNQSVEAATNSLNKYFKIIDKFKSNGAFDEIDAGKLKFEKLTNATLLATKSLQDFIKTRNKYKKLEDNLQSGGLTRWTDIPLVEVDEKNTDKLIKFKEEYQDLMKAVQAGVSITEIQGGNWFESIWKTKSDAKSDLGEMQKRVIQDIEYRINNLDLSKGEDELRNFFDIIDDEMYATALANIENLFPEEDWAKVLKARLEQVRDYYNQMVDVADETNQKINEEWIKEFERQKELEKKIRDNNTQAIEDDFKRQMKELKDQRRDEVDAAEGNLKLIATINKKYNRLELDAIKAHQKEIDDLHKEEADKLADALKKLRDLRLENEEESLKKRIKALNYQRDDALEEVKKEGLLVNELSYEINVKYDKLIEKEKKEYYKNLVDLAEEYAEKMIDVQNEMRKYQLEDRMEKIDISYNVSTGSSEGSFDFTAEYAQRIEAEKQFNAERLAIELEYQRAKLAVEKDEVEVNYDERLENEKRYYEDSVENLKKSREEGLMTDEEFDELFLKEKELYQEKLYNIEYQKTEDVKNLEKQYQNERKDLISQSLTDEVSLYEQYSNDISDILNKVGEKKNIFGVTDFGAAKKQYDAAKDVVKEGIKDIENEEKSLDDKLKNNEITFVDYKAAKQQLQETKKTLESEGKDITDGMKDLFKTVSQEWMGLANSWVSQISSLLSTMNDTQMILIDNQLAEIEHQLEIQQEAYDKAEEAAQKHKDKMDSIEDELKDSRGARRQFLIDVLASQQAAYLEDLKAQQDAEKEKEKLEKKQEALEKKRKEQEKKAKIQQAVINTFMAVSNALAVSPWFVGLALSAVALGLGMKNVAAIKSTPIYEDGGVIRGKRHKDGGVPIMGGQAEVEGGEFITNRKSTAANLPLLTMINEKKRAITAEDIVQLLATNKPSIKNKSFSKFENGGQLPNYSDDVNRVIQVANANEENKQYVVQVVDIINAQENLTKVKTLSGLNNK